MKASAILTLPDSELGKTCTRCGNFKPLADFGRLPRVRDGATSRCKECISALNKEATERHAADEGRVIPALKQCSHCNQTKANSDFYPRPGTRCGLSSRCRLCTKQLSNEWAASHRERSREKAAEWKLENGLRHQQLSAAWRERNRERKRSNDAKHYRENKERWRLYAEHRRARKHAAPGVVSRDIVQKLFRLQRGRCACCGLPLQHDFHLDHVIPLILGGAHDDRNLQLLRSKCNLQKNRKHPVQFMRERGFLL